MKFYETHFDDYIKSLNNNNLHTNIKKTNFHGMDSSDEYNFAGLKNLIIYGPPGIGKYSQALNIIKNYSNSKLKYEKRMIITNNKTSHYFKISDIHYEIDMSILGCNAKGLWHEIYNQIVDIISSKNQKNGIILCKYFHEIHHELLEIFYSYMQKLYNSCLNIKFILLTENFTFLPDNILNYCAHIKLPRPSRNSYNKCLKLKLKSEDNIRNLNNIKDLKNGEINLLENHKNICDLIIDKIINYDTLKFLNLREFLYDICILDLNILNCIWYIMGDLIKRDLINKKHINEIFIKTYVFLKYYNNNYRPIYHLERYILYIISIVHEL